MHVKFTIVGERRNDLIGREVDMDAIPRLGEMVAYPWPEDISGGVELCVRTIVWYPFYNPKPMVYIVLGEPRR